jgi:hypothetical protein
LTGVTIFPTVCDDIEAADLIVKGERSFIDPRWKEKSYGEGQLAEIIRDCWAVNLKERPSIGTVVVLLRNAIQGHLKWQGKQSKLRHPNSASAQRLKTRAILPEHVIQIEY